ncbi:GntR family transcriptional regulator [Paenibacillus sp. MY03]|uniref:GntR family transcriptional regulator n=1 Tax=Paenibacillus sp. MY03 TaxID=302980 RepID=UPI0015C5D9CD|nr:GntR family transcriptional regulator [Paenibacillus sp. MY03]
MGKPTLRQLAYDNIHSWIVNGELPRGSVTSEIELGKRLDMSRTPIRAALQQLELEGYVRIASKHGILILDSSSERVGDLLEMIASMILFAGILSWHTRQEELLLFSRSQSERLAVLLRENDGDARNRQAFIDFEYGLLRDLIAMCHNKEMDKSYQTASSRLLWHLNDRRWTAPHNGTTSEQLTRFVQSLALGMEAFREALFAYLQTLKRTWS